MAHHVPPIVRVLRALSTATLAAVALTISCATSPDSTHQTIDVFTVGDAFSPVFATANVGDTVRWSFTGGSDGQGHNVRFAIVAGSPQDINVLKTGTASRVFTTRGTFNYFCDVHPGMNGSVTVQ